MRVQTKCQKCNKRAKRLAKDLGFEGYCMKHARVVIAELAYEGKSAQEIAILERKGVSK